MNTVLFTGRLVADPEVRNNNGSLVATFNLAIDRPKKDANGTWTHDTDYARCVIFGKQADWFGNNAKKGYEVFVNANLKTGSYNKADGTKVFTHDFWCSDVKIIGVPKNNAPQNNAPAQQAPPTSVNNPNLSWNNGQQAPAQNAQPTPPPAQQPPQNAQPSAPTANMQPTYADPYGGFVDQGFAPYS